MEFRTTTRIISISSERRALVAPLLLACVLFGAHSNAFATGGGSYNCSIGPCEDPPSGTGSTSQAYNLINDTGSTYISGAPGLNPWHPFDVQALSAQSGGSVELGSPYWTANGSIQYYCYDITDNHHQGIFIPMGSPEEFASFINSGFVAGGTGATVVPCAASPANDCGTDEGGSFGNPPGPPAAGLCKAAQATASGIPALVGPVGSQSWQWSCVDNSSGTPVSCSAAYTPAGCPGGIQPWSVGGVNCQGNVPALASGGTYNAMSAAPSGVGNATFACNNGILSVQAGDSCLAAASSCAWTRIAEADVPASTMLAHWIQNESIVAESKISDLLPSAYACTPGSPPIYTLGQQMGLGGIYDGETASGAGSATLWTGAPRPIGATIVTSGTFPTAPCTSAQNGQVRTGWDQPPGIFCPPGSPGNALPDNSQWQCTCPATGPVNGACGSANGQTTITSTPTGSQLCSAGTASGFTLAGPPIWVWSCVGSGGGTSATCGASNGASTSCSSGPPYAFPGMCMACCEAGCAAAIASGQPCSVNCATACPPAATCGPANGGTYSDVAALTAAGLCSSGETASSVTQSGSTANWTCNSGSGSPASCSATISTVTGCRASGVFAWCGCSGGPFPVASMCCSDAAHPTTTSSCVHCLPGHGVAYNFVCN